MSETIVKIVDEFRRMLEEGVCETVEAERERCTSVIVKAKMDAVRKADYEMTASLRDCEHAIRVPEAKPKPAPPAEEPMTVDEAMAKCRTNFGWDGIEADLTNLIRARARRDVELCRNLYVYVGPGCRPDWLAACQECERLIRADADLE